MILRQSIWQFLWSFYMQQPKVELRVHPMLSVSCSHTSWICGGHHTSDHHCHEIPISHRQKVNSLFSLQMGKGTTLLTTCRKTYTLIHAENCPMVTLHFPHARNVYCFFTAYIRVLRWFKAVSALGIHSKIFKVFSHSTLCDNLAIFFANTLFVVDCFHCWDRVGCSSGYCIDTYNMSLMK